MEVDTTKIVTEGVTYNSTEGPPFEFSNYTHRVIVATLILIISLIGTFGNTLVILAVLLSKKVRTATNALVVNLSVADLLTCLVIPWDAIALLGKDGLPFGEWICSVASVVLNSSLGCSIFSLAFIALNRLLLITRPIATYRKIYTRKKIAAWLAVTWSVPLTLTVLPSIIKVGDLTYDPKYHLCGASASHPRSKFFAILVGGIIFPVLLITIIVCYVLIWRFLIRHAKMILGSREEPSEPTTTTTSVGNSDIHLPTPAPARASTVTAARPQLSRRQAEITKNMFFVVCAFMLCFTPYAVVMFLGNNRARPFLYCVLLFNSCVNPVIYATKHRDFKAIFGSILRRQWGNIPEPSEFLKTLRKSK